MAVHRKKLYTNGLWDSFYHLGRTVPKLTSLALMSLGYGKHMTARVMYMFVQCMFVVEDMFFFYIQMAVKFISEARVGINRLQVWKYIFLLFVSLLFNSFSFFIFLFGHFNIFA